MTDDYVVGDLSAILRTGDVSNNEFRKNPSPADSEPEETDSEASDSDGSGSTSSGDSNEGSGDSDVEISSPEDGGKETAVQGPEEEDPEERNRRTIFVGNLDLETTAKKLKQLFSEFGPVESVRPWNSI